ncbi:MAG: PepSY-associated TM helix domain-containing protein [Vicinamibacterales bacterium]
MVGLPACAAPEAELKLRTVVFWSHLTIALVAGVVIFVMCVTGALLAFEKQLVAWTERDFRSTPIEGRAALPVAALEARVVEQMPGFAATGLSLANEVDAPAVFQAGRRTLFVDRYSGNVLGESKEGGLRVALSTLRSWHRWIGAEGTWRPIGKFLTGWSNLIFAVIVLTGLYLWMPSTWTWARVRQVIWFRGAKGKARDFNWHHVVGLWSAVPLLVLIIGGLPISFPWAGNLLYRIAGDTPPAARGQGGSGGRGPAGPGVEAPRPTPVMLAATDIGLAHARETVSDWRTISVRWPRSARGHMDVTIDRGTSGQPQYRVSMEVDPSTGEVEETQAFADQSPGRRLRSISRFAHTGEILGIPGQAVAGLASAGGALLTWTGFALAWRRWTSWRQRRRTAATAVSRNPEPAISAAGNAAAMATPSRGVSPLA